MLVILFLSYVLGNETYLIHKEVKDIHTCEDMIRHIRMVEKHRPLLSSKVVINKLECREVIREL